MHIPRLVDRLKSFQNRAVYIPNGVSMSRIACGERDRTRADGLQGKKVVSLIGLTSSPSLFFVDALALAARAGAQSSSSLWLEEAISPPHRGALLASSGCHLCHGMGSQHQIGHYFAATDLGLYPGDSKPYFDAACPLKVLEYTAARRPVVATDLEELRRLAFPNVRLAPPDPERFASAIMTSLCEPTEFADVSGFEWATLAQTVRQTLAKLVQEQRR